MDLRKTVDCVYFLKGQCRNGAACPFKHDSAKNPSGPTALPIAAPAKQSEDCYYFLHGRCAKGNQCLFLHDQVCYVFVMRALKILITDATAI